MTDSTNKDNQEIDLFKLIYVCLFKIKEFTKKNFIPFIILSLLGASLGYYISPKLKKYESRIILTPNFNSTDYLYNEIDYINSRIQDKDSVFLKKIGFDNTISNIEIKPIISVYQFVQSNEKNFDLIKLFAEDGDINKVAEDEKTAKNYSYHQIIITTKYPNLDTSKTDLLFKYLNKNTYYNKLKEVSAQNLEQRIQTNNLTIGQINEILNKFSEENPHEKSSNLVYFNDNTQLNEIIDTKSNIIKENEDIIKGRLSSDKTIKDISQSLNIKQKSKSNLLVIIFPILFIIIYLTIKQLFLKKH